MRVCALRVREKTGVKNSFTSLVWPAKQTPASQRAPALQAIQHGRECCKWLVKHLDENIRVLQQFKINE
jgi:predicted metal-binding transcription factor (methanogenesis marker protein 9)